MAKIALIETKPSRTNFSQYFPFEFDRYALCSDPNLKKVLKRDVDIDINVDNYDWVILVGADALKYFTKYTSVTEYSGKVIDDKFIPIINPAMLKFKPEITRVWDDSLKSLVGFIEGSKKIAKYNPDSFIGITEEEEALAYVDEAIRSPNKFVALDSETSGLSYKKNYVLGISVSHRKDQGVYISAEALTDRVIERFQRLWDIKIVIFHNSKFDLPFMASNFGWTFPQYEDTMLLHYCIDENPGTHGLKQLALKYTDYGDYEQPMYEWINNYCKAHGVLKADFSWETIPFEIMKTYAAIDACVTFLIFIKLRPAVNKNPYLKKLYEEILLPANAFLIEMQDNGVPFSPERLRFGQKEMQKVIDESVEELYKHEEVKKFEEFQGKPFNPNSTLQLRKLLFDYLKLQPTGKKTSTNADSTDKEVLAELAEYHDVPNLILAIRQKSKIKNTYLDKILVGLDPDNRLRTNFNLHGTVAGRLSSSGLLNMQQLPRDAPAVKGSIKAREGYAIVSMDLTTAEVYVAACLSGDKKLQDVFISGGDFHSTIAKRVFKLSCPVEEVKKLFPLLRQAAKAITFGILYGSGPSKVSETVNKEAKKEGIDYHFSIEEAKEAISDYFKEFKQLKKWIDKNTETIRTQGFIYSHFGRKRRLPNVFSDDRGVSGHAIRSGINFLIQSPASDINLLAAVEMHNHIKNVSKIDAKIFALVHDSVLAEVKLEHVEKYKADLQTFVQKDRGIQIPNFPIGCDFDVGSDYSFGKFDDLYGEYFNG